MLAHMGLRGASIGYAPRGVERLLEASQSGPNEATVRVLEDPMLMRGTGRRKGRSPGDRDWTAPNSR